MTKRVLIVDNNMVSRMMIKEIVLETNPGWTIVQAASHEKAIEACVSAAFDYISLDLDVLGEQYLDLLEVVLDSQQQARIALVGAQRPVNIEESVTNARVEFISKPIDVSVIQEFID